MPRTEYVRNKEGSNIGKIVIDRDLCIGVASCVTVDAEVFKLDDEHKAVVMDPNLTDDELLTMAAQSCPTQAIILYDKEGKQIFP